MARHRVRNVFLPPTALKLIRRSGARPGPDLRLRSVASGGETLGAELLDWGRDVLGMTINEFYGQTECNLVVSNSAGHHAGPARIDGPTGAGPRGRDHRRRRAPCCRPARSARSPLRRPDPVMFLGYWNRPEATLAKFSGDWLRTGRSGEHGRRRLRLVPGAQRRRHHQRRLPDRAGRDRGLPAPPPGGRDGRRRRHPGPRSDRDRQGVRRARTRASCRRPR